MDKNHTCTTIEDILYHDGLNGLMGRDLLNELKSGLIGHDIKVPTTEGAKTFVNLDNAASTPTFLPIFNSFIQACFLPQELKNKLVMEVRHLAGKFLDAPPEKYDIFFVEGML